MLARTFKTAQRVTPRSFAATTFSRPQTTEASSASVDRLPLRLDRLKPPKTHTTYNKPFTARKQFLFSEYDKQISQTQGMIVVQHYNLNGSELMDLRRSLKQQAMGAQLMVVRAKMARAVVRDTKYANLAPLFTGPNAIVFWNSECRDQLAAMKLALDCMTKQKKLLVVGAKYQDILLNSEMLKEFVNLPNIEQLRAQLVGLVETPARQLASILNRLPQSLVGVIKQMSEKS
ncbi:hypothetical protein IWW36_001054 [Coemansia brasiliensis]|uniref:Ribosomal protein L10 n=1 Tax=Coemansia brasiliensis TaxID=2650707 RepID=A0A9W8IA06_9FUNG|nr:hypothetical protein IWW36_001054 [Coemansia brasiliensis]